MKVNKFYLGVGLLNLVALILMTSTKVEGCFDFFLIIINGAGFIFNGANSLYNEVTKR